MKKNILNEIVASLLILLWLYTGVSKLLKLDGNLISLSRQPLPIWSVPILGYGLPIIEIFVAVALIFERFRTIGYYASAFLMTSFTVYIGLILTHSLGAMPCSCGGVLKNLTWEQHMIFNLFFLALAVKGIFLQRRFRIQGQRHKLAT